MDEREREYLKTIVAGYLEKQDELAQAYGEVTKYRENPAVTAYLAAKRKLEEVHEQLDLYKRDLSESVTGTVVVNIDGDFYAVDRYEVVKVGEVF